MTKTLALCINLPDLQADLTNHALCERYPGSGYVPYLVKLAQDAGWHVLGGRDALMRVVHGGRDAKDFYVLQEEFNQHGLQLVRLGAKPAVLLCMESKMYTPRFYDVLPELKKVFRRQILFDGGTDYLYFPSFDEAELDKPRKPWSERKGTCMISSNKQWWSLPPQWDSPSYCEAIRNELHTARLRAIADNPEMDLYGYGWDNLDNIPPHWAYLKPQIARQWKGVVPVGEKLSVMENYGHAVCIENVNLPHYRTEKIPQALLAGCYMTDSMLAIRAGGIDVNWHTYQAFAKTVWGCVNG